MEITIATSLTPDELAALDRLRRGVSRAEALRDAVHWYARWAGRLPLQDPAEDAIDA